MTLQEVLPFLIPLGIIELALFIFTLHHILTHKTYKHGTRTLWVLIVVLGMNLVGPVLYFLFGKEDV